MFNQEVKAKWIAALRSGDYMQGTGELKSQDGRFCCLGVLEDIEPSVRKDGPHRGVLHSMTWERLGGTNRFVCPPTVLCQTVLSEMNDQGRSFAEIADFIEANY